MAMLMSFFKEDRKEQVDILVFCQKCGKSKSSKRKGSLTSWIFQDSRCTCDIDEASKSTSEHDDAETADLSDLKSSEEDSPGANNLNPDFGNRFEVLSLLGQGGMGSVYKVHDKDLGKDFAIKMLNPALAQDKAATKRFQLEAQMASALTHPNLITVYTNGVAPSGAPYIVMDFVEGKTLAEILKDGKPLHPMRVVDLFLQISEAVAHAHMKGVIHRDLKPSNILVSQSENNIEIARVADFGIGKLRLPEGETAGLTQTGEVFGSPTYMSPEQGEGEKLDSRSDIYSLGCVMYEALTGKPPFTGANPVKIIMKHLTEPPPAFPEDLQLPNSLERVVFHCLEKDPALRYQTAQDLIKDLERVRDGNDAIAHAPSHTLVVAPKETPESEKPLQVHPSAYLWEKISAIEVIILCVVVIFLPKYVPFEPALITSAILLLLTAAIYHQKEQFRTASRLILQAPPVTEIEGTLRWSFDWRCSWLCDWNRFMVPTLDIQDPVSPRKKLTLSVMFEKKNKEVLKALSDGKPKKLRMLVDPETGIPAALLVNNFVSLLLDERTRICLECRPLSICLRRIAAAITDGLIVASPFAVLLLFAGQLSSNLVQLHMTGDDLTHLAAFLTSIAFTDMICPIVAPYVYLAITAGGGGPFTEGTTAQALLPVAILMIAAANLLYHVGFESSSLRATPGKHLFNLTVSVRSGRQLSTVRSLGLATIRHVAKTLVFAFIGSLCGVLIFSSGFADNTIDNIISEAVLKKFPAILLMSVGVIFFSSLLNRKLQSLHDLCSLTRVNSRAKARWQTVSATVLIFALAFSGPIAIRHSYKPVMYELTQMAAQQQAEKLTIAIKKEPSNVKALQERAGIYFTASRFEDAAHDYERLMQLKPDEYSNMVRLGASYVFGNRVEDGVNLLTKAISLKPNEGAAYFERALANLIGGDTLKSIDDFEKSLKLLSSQDDCTAFAVLAYKAQGRPADAKRLLSSAREAIQKNEKPSLILSYLDGQITAKQLLERDSLDGKYAFFLGVELALTGKRTEAIELLKETEKKTAATPFNMPYYQVGTAILARLQSEN